MGGIGRALLGLICCWASVALSDPPTVEVSTTYPDRGEFFQVSLLSGDTTVAGTYLTGLGLQQLFQAYVVKADSVGNPLWSRFWGTTNVMYDCLWEGGLGTMVGYTTENATPDYKLVQFSSAGSLQNQWDFGGNTRADRGYSISAYDSNYVLVVGSVTPGDSSASDGSLVLVGNDGQVEWSHTYHSAAIIRRVIRDENGEIVLFGTADSVAGRNRDFWIGHADSAGELLFSYRFGAARTEELFDAVRVNSALTLLVGSTRSFGDSTKTNAFLLATNDNGDSLWSDVIGGTENDAALCIQTVSDRDSGFVIGGYWSEQLLGTRNAFLMKYDQEFDSIWTVVFQDTAVASEFRDVTVDNRYRYHAAGVRNTGFPHGFYVITGIDPAAPMQHDPDPFSLLSPADGAFITVDTIRFRWEVTSDPDPGDQIAYALLLDSDTLFDNPQVYGPLMPATRLVVATDDVFDRYWRVAAQDQHGNVTVCTDRHWHVRKIRPDSTQAFDLIGPPDREPIPNPFATFSWEHALDPDGEDDRVLYCLFFQVGDSISLIDTLYDTTATVNFSEHSFIDQSDTVRWWVVADSDYPQMMRASNQTWTFVNWNTSVDGEPTLPSEFSFRDAYPNPFNATTNLEFTLPSGGETKLVIFDVMGREVSALVDGWFPLGRHTVHWNAETAASGVYFARLSRGSAFATRKLLLMK